MMLKNQVEWVLHCCAILAGLPKDRFLSAQALAEFHGVPKDYLAKALQGLSQASIITGTLGPSGGYRLAKKPSDITFLEVVEAVEGKSRTFLCSEIRKNNPCRPRGTREPKPCAIARVMWEADEEWRNRLRQARLSDLIDTLAEEIPEKLYRESFEWVLARA